MADPPDDDGHPGERRHHQGQWWIWALGRWVRRDQYLARPPDDRGGPGGLGGLGGGRPRSRDEPAVDD